MCAAQQKNGVAQRNLLGNQWNNSYDKNNDNCMRNIIGKCF